MLISNYSYLCSEKILKRISEISNDSIITQISNNYSKGFNLSNQVDVLWALISTSLLMSENMFKNSKTYNYISKRAIDEIEHNLQNFERLYPNEPAKKPSLLDSENKPANSFSDFLNQRDVDNGLFYKEPEYDDTNLSVEDEIYFQEIYRRGEKFYNSMLIDGPYGCNGSIISDGLINIRSLIRMVRNAIAHSNYEVISSDCIRLFHYCGKNKLDFNITLDISTIMIIVDELNEIAYEKYKFFVDFCHYERFLDYEIFDKEDILDDDLINFIMSFKLCDKDMAKMILKKAYESEIYSKLSQDEETSDNYNKLVAICEAMINYIKPCCEFGSIINNFMYSTEKGYIFSDELYNKYGIYNYLKSDMYETNYADKKEKNYKQNELRLLILSFLNCSLLATHNDIENKNNTFPKIDFSSIIIDKKIMDLFTQKHINSNTHLIENLQQKYIGINNLISNKENFLNIKKEALSKNKIDNDYFNITLPNQIKMCELEINQLNQDKVKLFEEIKKITREVVNYNYYESLSDFVFRSLRNSLAHGYVRINGDLLNSLSDVDIIFEDYDPDNKNELTFYGKIKISDLLKCLTADDTVIDLYGKESVLLSNVHDNNVLKNRLVY